MPFARIRQGWRTGGRGWSQPGYRFAFHVCQGGTAVSFFPLFSCIAGSAAHSALATVLSSLAFLRPFAPQISAGGAAPAAGSSVSQAWFPRLPLKLIQDFSLAGEFKKKRKKKKRKLSRLEMNDPSAPRSAPPPPPPVSLPSLSRIWGGGPLSADGFWGGLRRQGLGQHAWRGFPMWSVPFSSLTFPLSKTVGSPANGKERNKQKQPTKLTISTVGPSLRPPASSLLHLRLIQSFNFSVP